MARLLAKKKTVETMRIGHMEMSTYGRADECLFRTLVCDSWIKGSGRCMARCGIDREEVSVVSL